MAISDQVEYSIKEAQDSLRNAYKILRILL